MTSIKVVKRISNRFTIKQRMASIKFKMKRYGYEIVDITRKSRLTYIATEVNGTKTLVSMNDDYEVTIWGTIK